MTKQLKNNILSNCEGSQVWKVGKWDWAMFKEKPSEEIRGTMKEEGGFYNGKRKVWQFSNGVHSRNSSRENSYIFEKYGAEE